MSVFQMVHQHGTCIGRAKLARIFGYNGLAVFFMNAAAGERRLLALHFQQERSHEHGK